jgi:MFS family permease
MPDLLAPSPLPDAQIFSSPWRRMAAALHRRPFRYFLAGSFLSNVGTWMQAVAQAWLVLELTDSAFYLGLDGFANTIPLSIFAFAGGLVADRVDRKRTLLAAQWVMMGLAISLAVLTQFGWIRVWQIIAFSFLTGLTQAISWPVYQAIMGDIADRRHLSNAIALNSAQFNLARTVGPVVGALALQWFGAAGCFYANALSFLGVVAALSQVKVATHPRPARAAVSVKAALQEGLAYIATQPGLLWLLITLAASSLLGVPLVTMLPVFARDILRIGPSGLGALVGALGAGAVTGGMIVAYRGDFPLKGQFVLRSFMLFVAAMIGFALSRQVILSLVCLGAAGFAMVGFASVINSLVQTNAPNEIRGRAMSLFIFAFGGVMPLGNLLAGALAHAYGASAAMVALGLALGGFVAFVRLGHPEILRLR